MVKTYAEFVDELPAEDIPLGDLAGGYTLNGPETARAKAEWARGAGLAGVVFWELGQDKVGHPQSLIRAAAGASGIATVTRTGGAENEPRRKARNLVNIVQYFKGATACIAYKGRDVKKFCV